MKKTLSRLLAIAMTASLVLSGCGGTGGSTSTEEGTSTEGNTTSTEGEATAEAGSENEIKDLVLVFCLAVSSKPLICCTLRELRTLKT